MKIGTRGSPLALAQAYLTRDLLKVLQGRSCQELHDISHKLMHLHVLLQLMTSAQHLDVMLASLRHLLLDPGSESLPRAQRR